MPSVSSSETPVALIRRARKIYRALGELYPDARCELDFENPLQLLVATVMSAQTTDVRVNLVTPVVFARFRTAADYACADRAELETMIQSTGFYRAKTDSPRGSRQPARRRAQDRQCGAGQRFRDPGDHR